jgi:2-polyprenyl-6-hydroxyphenyl methylase / 3-demethylubiquinone-9 3-methyltransferase
MAKETLINQGVYDELGLRWYTALDDPVALLRAQSKLLGPWVLSEIIKRYGDKKVKVIDVGCGGGFNANQIARAGHRVTGLDISQESLGVARTFDFTHSVSYVHGNAYQLDFPNKSFDVVTCMDFLEHVEDVQAVVKEISRVLKPGGMFFFHTFNRTPIANLIAIKFVEWFVKNTPKHLHLYRMFVKPKELDSYCHKNGLNVQQWLGMRPRISISFFKGMIQGSVPEDFSFVFGKSLGISYCGVATKVL